MVETISREEYLAQNARVGKRKRRNKFGAKPCRIDGHYFPSQLEGRRYNQLKLLLLANAIRNLKLQPRFDLHAAGVKVGEYRGDFAYEERACIGRIFKWVTVVEDTKGAMTPVYKLKKAMFLQLYPDIDFRELKR